MISYQSFVERLYMDSKLFWVEFIWTDLGDEIFDWRFQWSNEAVIIVLRLFPQMIYFVLSYQLLSLQHFLPFLLILNHPRDRLIVLGKDINAKYLVLVCKPLLFLGLSGLEEPSCIGNIERGWSFVQVEIQTRVIYIMTVIELFRFVIILIAFSLFVNGWQMILKRRNRPSYTCAGFSQLRSLHELVLQHVYWFRQYFILRFVDYLCLLIHLSYLVSKNIYFLSIRISLIMALVLGTSEGIVVLFFEIIINQSFYRGHAIYVCYVMIFPVYIFGRLLLF